MSDLTDRIHAEIDARGPMDWPSWLAVGRRLFAVVMNADAERPDGTVTPMVLAVTNEAVRGTLLYESLVRTLLFDCNPPHEDILKALHVLGFANSEDITPVGRTILLALSAVGAPAETPAKPSAQDVLIEQALVVMQRFIDKCERGDARSVRTLAECRDWMTAYRRTVLTNVIRTADAADGDAE